MHVFPRRWLFLGVCSVTLGIGETVVIATDVAFWLRRGDPMPLPFISVAKSMPVAAGASMSREGTDTISMSAVPRGATATLTTSNACGSTSVCCASLTSTARGAPTSATGVTGPTSCRSSISVGAAPAKSPGPKTFLSIGQMPVLRNPLTAVVIVASRTYALLNSPAV